MGVKLVNAAAKAEFAFPETETKSSYVLQQSQWSNWSEKDDPTKAYMIKGGAPVILTADAQRIMFGDDNFMLIPQQLTAWTVLLQLLVLTCPCSVAYTAWTAPMKYCFTRNRQQVMPRTANTHSLP